MSLRTLVCLPLLSLLFAARLCTAAAVPPKGACDQRAATCAQDHSLLQTRQALVGASESSQELERSRRQIADLEKAAVECEPPTDADRGFISFGFKADANRPNLLAETVKIFDVPANAFDWQSYPNAQTSWISSGSIRETASKFGTESGIDVKYKAFSASARMSTETANSEKVEKFRVDQVVKTQKYQVMLNSLYPYRLLTDVAKRFLLEETPERIVDRLGEFYAHKLTLGGVFQATFVKERTESESAKSFEAEVQVHAKFLVGSVNGHSKVSMSDSERAILAQTSNSYMAKGGDVSLWLGLMGDNAPEIQSRWAKSVTDANLFPVHFDLRPLWTLLDHDDMDRAKARELENYLTTRWREEDAAIPTYELARPHLMYNSDVIIENQYDAQNGRPLMLQRNGYPDFTSSVHSINNKAAVWKIKTTARGGAGPVSYGDEVIIEQQYAGLYLLHRNGNPSFTTDRKRITNKAAVWRIWNKDLEGEGSVALDDEIVIQNAHAGHWLLGRAGKPPKVRFTTDRSRIASRAATWKFKSLRIH